MLQLLLRAASAHGHAWLGTWALAAIEGEIDASTTFQSACLGDTPLARAHAGEAANCVCVIPFIKRAERGRHTPHNYESTPVNPLRHVGIVSSTEAHR